MGDPTAHAEIMAIRRASSRQQGWRLPDTTMYVTLEPCPILCWGHRDGQDQQVGDWNYNPKTGACGSLWNITCDDRLNHKVEVIYGIMEDECREILRSFQYAKDEQGM